MPFGGKFLTEMLKTERAEKSWKNIYFGRIFKPELYTKMS